MYNLNKVGYEHGAHVQVHDAVIIQVHSIIGSKEMLVSDADSD